MIPRVIAFAVAFVCFGAVRAAEAAPAVEIQAPAADVAVEDTARISATVTSTYAISNVHAAVQSTGTDLVASGPSFKGTLDLSAFPTGPLTLTVTATDAVAATGSASVAFKHDHKPALAILTPEGAVGRPQIRLQATCTDNDAYGCSSITAQIRNGAVLATSSGASLDQTVALTPGTSPTIDFTATDTAGLSAVQSIQVYADTSPALVEVVHGDGPILDFDATRILFRTPSAIVIRPRNGGADTVIDGVTPPAPPYGGIVAYFTPLGVLWTGGEIRNGVRTTNTAVTALVVRGGYAIWQTGIGNGVDGLVDVIYRDVVADTNTTLATKVYGTFGTDVAANGDAVGAWDNPSTNKFQVQRYHAGVTTALTNPASPYTEPLTDGINVVYHRHCATCWLGITLNDAEITTGTPPNGTATNREPIGGTDYQVAAGWTAFTDWVGLNTYVYTRSPAGTRALASVINANTTIDRLADTGEVMYFADNTRYLGAAGAGAPATVTSHTLGRSYYRDGKWYVVIGASLFAVVPDAGDSDAGVDAGSSDAGSSDAAGASDADADATATPDAGIADASVAPDAGIRDATVPPASSDASASATDVSASNGESSDDSGCSASPRGPRSSYGALAILAVTLATLRRRRRAAELDERA